jgi:hypothetical protein
LTARSPRPDFVATATKFGREWEESLGAAARIYSRIATRLRVFPKSPTRHLSDHDVIKLLKRTDRLLFRSGMAFRYGDSGYAVLAIVVEQMTDPDFTTIKRESHG